MIGVSLGKNTRNSVIGHRQGTRHAYRTGIKRRYMWSSNSGATEVRTAEKYESGLGNLG